MVTRFWGSPGVASGEQRGVTFTVAASDSSANNIGRADYVCNGVDDHVEINQALAALPSVGGRVVLLEGTFTIDGPLTVPSNSCLEGQGNGTTVKLDVNHTTTPHWLIQNSDQTAGNSNIRIADMVIDGNKSNQVAGRLHYGIDIKVSSQILIEDVVFQALSSNGIRITGTAAIACTDIMITRCIFKTIDDDAIIATSSAGGENQRLIITANILRGIGSGSGSGIDLTLTDNSTASYNQIDSFGANGINLDTCDYVAIDSNICDSNVTNGISVVTAGSIGISIVGNICTNNTVDGIVVNGPDDLTISGNLCRSNTEDGISITGANSSVISGNNCTRNGTHGMFFSTCTDTTIVGNSSTINSQTTDDTSCNIILNDNVDDCIVQGNLCRHGGGANQAKYGIHVANANCDTNMVTNNDLLDSGKTGDLQDDGTGTVTAAGNRT